MTIDMHTCPICKSSAKVEEFNGSDEYGINCRRCGLFDIADDALIKFQRSDLKDKIRATFPTEAKMEDN